MSEINQKNQNFPGVDGKIFLESPDSLMEKLRPFWKKGADFLGSRYGILGGAMTWISNHCLVSAISNAGGFGVLAGGALSPGDLEKEILLTKSQTSQTFGVNVIVFHPKLQELIEICARNNVTHIFLGGGSPSGSLIRQIRDKGMRVVGFAPPSLLLSQRLVKMGIEALVAEGNEAGGHVGPVTSAVLASLLLDKGLDVPIFFAGGIGTGSDIASYLLRGASGCQLGTRFVCANESMAHPKMKQAFIRASARDASVSFGIDPRLSVIPVRALDNEGKKDFLHFQHQVLQGHESGEKTLKEAQMDIEFFWAGALRRAVVEGDVRHGSLMAGQSVGSVTCQEPAETIIFQLCQETWEALCCQSRRWASLAHWEPLLQTLPKTEENGLKVS